MIERLTTRSGGATSDDQARAARANSLRVMPVTATLQDKNRQRVQDHDVQIEHIPFRGDRIRLTNGKTHIVDELTWVVMSHNNLPLLEITVSPL
jgi:hypothetical protein